MAAEKQSMAATYADRVREHTDRHANWKISRQIEANVGFFAAHERDHEGLSRRIAELEREWDMERILEVNASALAFTGLALGLLKHRGWLALPVMVLPFLFQHAVQGWCPPVEALRRLGVRTRKEIELEKYALKALRGDFEPLGAADDLSRANWAISAVSAK